MRYCSWPLIFLLFLLFSSGAYQPAAAQELPQDNYFFLRTQLGLSAYTGDLSSLNTKIRSFGLPAIGWETGYQLTPAFTVAAGLQAADYPRLSPDHSWHTWRFTSLLVLQSFFTPHKLFSPYLRGGMHITTGNNLSEGSTVGFGPTLGAGLRYAPSFYLSIFLETTVNASFPDEAVDGISRQGEYDALSVTGIGIRFNLTSPPSLPFTLGAIEAPDTFKANEQVIFSTSTGSSTPEEVTYRWELGDGTTAQGLSVRHAYAKAGRYQVTLHASTNNSQQQKTAFVTVRPAFSEKATAACLETLETADRAYRRRRFSQAIDTLSQCLQNKAVAVKGKVSAYRLRTLVHLKQGEVDEARNVILQLLNLQPTYQADPVQDPPSYVSLVSIVKKQLNE